MHEKQFVTFCQITSKFRYCYPCFFGGLFWSFLVSFVLHGLLHRSVEKGHWKAHSSTIFGNSPVCYEWLAYEGRYSHWYPDCQGWHPWPASACSIPLAPSTPRNLKGILPNIHICGANIVKHWSKFCVYPIDSIEDSNHPSAIVALVNPICILST